MSRETGCQRRCEDYAAWADYSELIPGETRQVALRWTLYDGAHAIFRCRHGAELGRFSQSIFAARCSGTECGYADVDGTLDIRRRPHSDSCGGDGSLPVSDDAHEWISYIPFDKLPRIYNPPSGIIATANGRIAPDDYPYSISAEWEAPWRTARIYHVLESGRKFATADMLALENDIQSENDLFAAERFVYAVDHAAKPSARAKQAAILCATGMGA